MLVHPTIVTYVDNGALETLAIYISFTSLLSDLRVSHSYQMAQVTATAPHPKHDIHKFQDIKPKLGCDNWVSWKHELLTMACDRGLYTIILRTDILPSHSDPNFTTINDIPHIGKIPLSQFIDKWHNRNNTAYNQILLCISLELQTAIDDTDEATIAWKILTKKFELTDPSKISIIRTHYKNYHMVEGQLVVSYLTSMKEFRSQLRKWGRILQIQRMQLCYSETCPNHGN